MLWVIPSCVWPSPDHSRDERAAPPIWFIAIGDAHSRLAQIAQQPALFDFPRERLPNNFHYTGPWHAIESADKMEFPWEKLDGRPLIYASMGTLQNRQQPIFQAIATACAGLDAQLVMSLGSHDQRLDLKLPEAAIVVPFAPQLD